MKLERLNIRKEILIWAVERNGQSVEEYAQKNPSFNKWIEVEKMPTIKQLEGFVSWGRTSASSPFFTGLRGARKNWERP